MRTADFDFHLPEKLIAQSPSTVRDASRLLVLHRRTGEIEHGERFGALLRYLREGDVLVLNDSRVIPARLRAHKEPTGGQIEVLLLREIATNDWWAMLRPGKRVRVGAHLQFEGSGTRSISAELVEKTPAGHCRLRFVGTADLRGELHEIGEIPLPPYIARPPTLEDGQRYQTVFAERSGSVAAPTAGLHFTSALLEQIRLVGVEIHRLTLHIGPGTFAPVKTDRVEEHEMHEEFYTLPEQTAERLNEARRSGRRILAVGTTTVRVLETVAAKNAGLLVGDEGPTRIFIYPPYKFRIIDALLTNFHLPQSTLLMLVSAFAAPGELHGRDLVLRAYAEAVRANYRFFSYGDAMLLL